jgi:putative thioredoxin
MVQIGETTMTADALVTDTTTQNFVKDVIEASKRQPVLVDFWAPWCGPCKQLTPILEKVVRAAKGKVKLVKMNIDEHPAIPGQMGIQSIPAVIAFSNGQPVDGFMGALPESQVSDFIKRMVKEPIEADDSTEALKTAEEVLAHGDAATAASIFAEIAAAEPENVAAFAGMVRAYVKAGEIEQAKQTLALIPQAKQNDPAVATARAALELAEQAKAVGPIGELEQKLAANPADHQARFDLAVALNAKGRREEAAEHLLTIVRRDRKWNDDAARKQLVQFFDAWGAADPTTVEGRKKLSSILFA